MVRFYVSSETNQAINSEGIKRIILFAGSYNGYYMNFGDLLQLRGVLRWHRKENPNSLLCPLLHVSPIPDKKFVDELTTFFGTPHWIFYVHEEENPSDQIVKLGLEPLRISSSVPSIILHVYGGGFFNSFWGHWMLKMIEDVLFIFPIEHYVISGQQVGKEFGPILAEHCRRYRPELVGCRDPISVEVLSKNGVNAVFSSDDAFEEMNSCAESLNRPLLEKENTFGLQLNLSSYVYLPSYQAEQNLSAQLQMEQIENLLTLLVARFGAGSVPILVDSYLAPRPEVQNMWISIKQSLLTKYFPHFIGVDLVGFLLQKKLSEAASILRSVSRFIATSYHTAFFAKIVGIPTYLLAFNDYYSQKCSGIEPKRRTLEEFLSETSDTIIREQDEIIQNHREARTKWLAELKQVLGSTNVQAAVARMTAYYQETSRRLQAELGEREKVIEGLRLEVSALQQEIAALRSQNSTLSEEVVSLQAELGEWQERSHAQQAQISQLQADLQRLWNSKSWRLTAPLRVIYGVLLQTRAWLKVQTILIAKKILPKPVKRSIKKAIGWEGEEELAIPPPAATKVIAFEQTPWKKGRPLVSVIIPCYNYGHYVEEAIDSVLQQTFQNFEIIVVNDGSTDPVTIEVLKHLKKPKTRVIHQANKGLPEARNEGIRHAKGKYICCLDADDTLEPTYLEKAVALLEANPGIAFAYSWVRLFGDEEKIWYTEPYDLEKLLRYNHISVASVFRYDAWKQVGGYCSEMRQGYEDWEFWIRLGSHGFRGQLIPEALFNHRRHGRTMTHEAQERHQKLVADIARRNQALFANPSLVKNIQRTYFDGRVNHPFLNLNDPKDFRQGDARPSLLILLPWLQIGGAETVLYQVMSGLQQLFRFYLFTTLPDKNEWHDRFYQLTKNIYHLPNFLPEYAWEDFLVNFIHTRDIQQVLISHSEFGYSILPKLKESFPNVRTVNLLHNDSDLGFFRHSVQYDSYLDLHIVVNELIKQKLHAMGKVDLAKVYTIYNAIDEEKVFNPALYQPEKVRERWQLPPGKKVVTYIGRLSREKQPDHFLRLAGKLKHYSDLFFLLVGDGPLRDIVEAEIKQLWLQEHLRWYKMVSPEQIPEILAGTDLMVLTSEVEGFPMVVLEALAMGVPVISYDVGDVRSVVQSGVNGFIIPPQQHELLVQKVSEVLSDESMLEGLRKRARVVLIERGFTLERMIKQYQEVLVPR